MHRDKLIAQVKNEYARLADASSQQHFGQTTTGLNAEVYYENLLNMVEHEISHGTFDGFHNGREVIEAVANNKKKWLSEWKPEAT
jgi:hypothetical protein